MKFNIKPGLIAGLMNIFDVALVHEIIKRFILFAFWKSDIQMAYLFRTIRGETKPVSKTSNSRVYETVRSGRWCHLLGEKGVQA